MAILADQLGLNSSTSPRATSTVRVALVPRSRRRAATNCLPIKLDENRLVIAMADPANVVAIDDIRALTKKDVRTVVATKADVLAALNRHYRLDRTAETLAEEAAAEKEEEEKSLEKVVESAGAEDAPIIKLVNMMITQAINDRASDIHIEPGERSLTVRFRIDGVRTR